MKRLLSSVNVIKIVRPLGWEGLLVRRHRNVLILIISLRGSQIFLGGTRCDLVSAQVVQKGRILGFRSFCILCCHFWLYGFTVWWFTCPSRLCHSVAFEDGLGGPCIIDISDGCCLELKIIDSDSNVTLF